MRNFKDILKARQRGDIDSVEKEVEGLPPGYIAGFALDINAEENSIQVGPGVANVRNRLVKLTDITPLTQDTATGGNFLFDTRYYIYVGIDGRISVDRVAPVFDGQLFGRYHPIGGMRFIGRFYVSEAGQIQEIISENPMNASSVSAEQIVAGSLDEIVSGVVEGLFDYTVIEEMINDRTTVEFVGQQVQNILNQFSAITANLFANDVVIGRQVRTLNFTEAGNAIDPNSAGFWLSATGKLKVNNADITGTLRSGGGAVSNARVAIQDQSGIIAGPLFSGTGLNDMTILREGAVAGEWEVEITHSGSVTTLIDTYQIGDYGPAGGVVFYDKGSTDHVFPDYGSEWQYLECWTSNETGGFSVESNQDFPGEGQYRWKLQSTLTPGLLSGLGLGYHNTYTHMNSSMFPAAYRAATSNHGGYSDWYLPNREELLALRNAKNPLAKSENISFEVPVESIGSPWFYFGYWNDPNIPRIDLLPKANFRQWPPHFQGLTTLWPETRLRREQLWSSEELNTTMAYAVTMQAHHHDGNDYLVRPAPAWLIERHPIYATFDVSSTGIPQAWTVTDLTANYDSLIVQPINKVPRLESFLTSRPVRAIRRFDPRSVITVPSRFKWRKIGEPWSDEIEIPLNQEYEIPFADIKIGFNNRFQHTVGDRWMFEQGAMKALSVVNDQNEEYVSISQNTVTFGSPFNPNANFIINGTLNHNGVITVAQPGPQGPRGFTGVKGDKGDPGRGFKIDSVGLLEQRDLLDYPRPPYANSDFGIWDGYVYYATDTSMLYMLRYDLSRGSHMPPEWTEGIPLIINDDYVITGKLEVQKLLRLQTYTENVVFQQWDSAAQVLDLSQASFFDVTIHTDITNLSFTNAPVGGSTSFTLIIKQLGTGHNIFWPSSVKWADENIEPVINIRNRTFILSFLTTTSGSTWYGFLSGGDFI